MELDAVAAYDDGRYWLRIDASALHRGGIVRLVVHPSVGGRALQEIVLFETCVERHFVGRAVGQAWPEGSNRPKLVRLPYKGLQVWEYEDAFGERLAGPVLLCLVMAYKAETTGVTGGGLLWRDRNLGVVLDWKLAVEELRVLLARLPFERRGRLGHESV